MSHKTVTEKLAAEGIPPTGYTPIRFEVTTPHGAEMVSRQASKAKVVVGSVTITFDAEGVHIQNGKPTLNEYSRGFNWSDVERVTFHLKDDDAS